MIYLNIEGGYGRGVTDVCDVAKITLENENNSFEFVASEFSFTLKDGLWLYNRLAGGTEADSIAIQVHDTAAGIDRFYGSLDAEGADYDDETGLYEFQCLDKSRFYVDAWKKKQAGFYWFQNDNYPIDYLEAMIQLNAGLPVVLPDQYCGAYKGKSYSWGPTTMTAYPSRNYSVYDFVNDAAKYMNAVWTIERINNTEYLHFAQRDKPPATRAFGREDAFTSKHALRGKDYTFVVFDADNGKQYIESLNDFRELKEDEDIDTSATLDLRFTYNNTDKQPAEFSGKKLFEILYPKRKPTRQGIWNYLFLPKEKHTIGWHTGLLDVNPGDMYFDFDDLTRTTNRGRVSKVVYDLIKETTTITHDKYFQ